MAYNNMTQKETTTKNWSFNKLVIEYGKYRFQSYVAAILRRYKDVSKERDQLKEQVRQLEEKITGSQKELF